MDELRLRLINVINHQDFDNITKGQLLEVLFGIAVEVDDVSNNDWLNEFNQYFVDAVQEQIDFINEPLNGTLEYELLSKARELDRIVKPKDFKRTSELFDAKVFNKVLGNLKSGNYLKSRDLN
ncbi:MAG: hypothetical protein ACXVH2_00860 [Methanobacterium sp.]